THVPTLLAGRRRQRPAGREATAAGSDLRRGDLGEVRADVAREPGRRRGMCARAHSHGGRQPRRLRPAAGRPWAGAAARPSYGHPGVGKSASDNWQEAT
ncbi:unnamed protein product, partial [Urochloa humidicola]